MKKYLSKGVTHLRSMKVTELHHDGNGKIETVDPYRNAKSSLNSSRTGQLQMHGIRFI